MEAKELKDKISRLEAKLDVLADKKDRITIEELYVKEKIDDLKERLEDLEETGEKS